MNEHKEQTGFYLVLPSPSSNEIFLENHAGRFTVLLSRQTESVRDHKFHSGYAHSSMDRGHFILHLHHTQE